MEGRLLRSAVMFAVCDRQKGPKMQTHQRNLTQNSVLLLDSKRTKQTGKPSWSVEVSIYGCSSPLLPFGVEPSKFHLDLIACNQQEGFLNPEQPTMPH